MNRELVIGDIFRSAARAVPNRVAAAMGAEEITFAQLDASANRTARALAKAGVARGDRVVAWGSTSLDAVALFAASAKLGAIFAPMDGGLGTDEAATMASTIGPAMLLVDSEHSEPGAEVAERIGATTAVMTGLFGNGEVTAGIPSLASDALGEDSADLVEPGLTEVDPHVIFFTSGTTGRSKGVVISHRVSYLRTHPGALLEPRGPLVCPYPLFHMGAWTLAMQQWQARDRVVLLPSFGSLTLCEAIQRHQAVRLNAIPAIWRRLLDQVATRGAQKFDLSSIRLADTGTSATPPELLEAIRRTLPGASLRVFYGSTEGGPVAMLEDSDISRKPGSCGVSVPTCEVRLDRTGEVLVRGPLLFDGYFDDPEATASAFVDGWYRMGDLAEVDEEGYLYIVGRAHDIIRSGGESIAPVEVEHVLAGNASVADVAVVGIPDAYWGEVVCAVVVPIDRDDPPTLEDLRAHCADRLARFKHPRRLVLVDSIPRTASTNQLQRRLLIERLEL